MENWQPKVIDIYKEAETDSYYGRFGFEKIEWSQAYANLYAHKDEIIRLMHNEYDLRMIGLETLEIWQYRMQAVYDRIAPGYDRAFGQYERWAERMLSDIVWKETRSLDENINGVTDRTQSTDAERDVTVTDSGTITDDTSVSSNTVTDNDTTAANIHQETDTPDSSVNASDIVLGAGYAGIVTRDNSSGTNDTTVSDNTIGKDTQTVNTTRTTADGTRTNTIGKDTESNIRQLMETVEREGDLGIMDAVNQNIARWRNLCNDFVKEFKQLFLGVYWY